MAKLLTVNEVAAQLHVGRARVYDLISRQLLVSIKLDGSRRISQEAVDRFVAEMEAKAAADSAESIAAPMRQ